MSPDAARGPRLGAASSAPGVSAPGASAACRGGLCPLARWRFQAGAAPGGPVGERTTAPCATSPDRRAGCGGGRRVAGPVRRDPASGGTAARAVLAAARRRTPGGPVVVLRGVPRPVTRPGGGPWRKRPNAGRGPKPTPVQPSGNGVRSPCPAASVPGSAPLARRGPASRSTRRPTVADHAVRVVPKPATAARAGHPVARPPAGATAPRCERPPRGTARRTLWGTRKWRRYGVPRGAVRPSLVRARRPLRFTPGPGGLPPRHPRAHASPQNTGPRNPR